MQYEVCSLITLSLDERFLRALALQYFVPTRRGARSRLTEESVQQSTINVFKCYLFLTVTLSNRERVARTRNEGVTEEFFGVWDYRCYTVVEISK
jgi:hypothetical protein